MAGTIVTYELVLLKEVDGNSIKGTLCNFFKNKLDPTNNNNQ